MSSNSNKQKGNLGQALFVLFNNLNAEAKEEFITHFAQEVFHTKVLIRPDGTVLIPNEETTKALEEQVSQKVKCNSLEDLFEKLDEEN